MPTTPQPNPRSLSPAVRYYLLLGEWPPVPKTTPHRAHGWVELAADWSRDEAAARKAAAAYADELAYEAGSSTLRPGLCPAVGHVVRGRNVGARPFWMIRLTCIDHARYRSVVERHDAPVVVDLLREVLSELRAIRAALETTHPAKKLSLEDRNDSGGCSLSLARRLVASCSRLEK